MSPDVISVLRGCRCTNNFAPGDLVQERKLPRDGRHDGIIKIERSDFAGQVVVEWSGVPEILGRTSEPMNELRHRGRCPVQITVGMRVRIIGSVLGLHEGETARVTGVAPSGIVTVQADSGDHAEAWRHNLVPLAH